MKFGVNTLIGGAGSQRGHWHGNRELDRDGWKVFASNLADRCNSFGVDKDVGMIERNIAGTSSYLGMRFTQWTDRFQGDELRRQTSDFVEAHELFIAKTGFFPKIYLGRVSDNPEFATYSDKMIHSVVVQAIAPIIPFARSGIETWIVIDASSWSDPDSYSARVAIMLEDMGIRVGYEAWPPVGGFWQNCGGRACFIQSDNSNGDGLGGYARIFKMTDTERAKHHLAARSDVGPELHVFVEQQNQPGPSTIAKWDADAVYLPVDTKGRYMGCTAADFRRIAGSVK